MQVQVIGINYAPERTGIAPYTAELAQHLAREHDVTVITGLPHYPDWHVPAEFRHWRSVEDHEGVRVIRVSHLCRDRPAFWAVRFTNLAGRCLPLPQVCASRPMS